MQPCQQYRNQLLGTAAFVSKLLGFSVCSIFFSKEAKQAGITFGHCGPQSIQSACNVFNGSCDPSNFTNCLQIESNFRNVISCVVEVSVSFDVVRH